MNEDVELDMRTTYASAKRWWGRVLGLWMAAVTISVLSVLLPVSSSVSAVLALVIGLATFAARWRAEWDYQNADAIRRSMLRSDGLGEDDQSPELARIRANAVTGPEDLAPLGTYYTARETKGPARLARNVQESAFYTSHLAGTAWKLCAMALAGVIVGAVVLLQLAANLASAGMSNAIVSALAVLVGSSIADVTRGYFLLAQGAGRSFEQTSLLLDRGRPSRADALRVADVYDAALANVPPIPSFIYEQRRVRLDTLWKTMKRSRQR